MLFNSLQFAIFFPVVTLLYFLLGKSARVPMLLAASCLFYMAFVPKYILILVALILIDFAAGLLIEQASGPRRRWFLVASLCANIGMLGFFKYFNFFNANISGLAHWIGWNYPAGILQVILPIGLSFHTFQSMSYTIEVYRGNFRAEHRLHYFALYVLFYPQLVAGPIERPQNLLHQFDEHHRFEWRRVWSGLRLMAAGLFKKIVIADRLALLVNEVYKQPGGCRARLFQPRHRVFGERSLAWRQLDLCGVGSRPRRRVHPLSREPPVAREMRDRPGNPEQFSYAGSRNFCYV